MEGFFYGEYLEIIRKNCGGNSKNDSGNLSRPWHAAGTDSDCLLSSLECQTYSNGTGTNLPSDRVYFGTINPKIVFSEVYLLCYNIGHASKDIC